MNNDNGEHSFLSYTIIFMCVACLPLLHVFLIANFNSWLKTILSIHVWISVDYQCLFLFYFFFFLLLALPSIIICCNAIFFSPLHISHPPRTKKVSLFFFILCLFDSWGLRCTETFYYFDWIKLKIFFSFYRSFPIFFIHYCCCFCHVLVFTSFPFFFC